MTELEQPGAATAAEPELSDDSLYFNRELSWLQFNDRVLQLAEDAAVPLLERVKFSAIYSSNLDEFFMVRVAGLQDQIDAGIEKPREDGRTPAETIDEIRRVGPRAARAPDRRAWTTSCGPRWPSTASASSATARCTDRDRDGARRSASSARSSRCSRRSPSGSAGRSRTSRTCRCRSPCSCATRRPAQETFARVKVPKEMLPRFVPVGDGRTFVPLEDLIAQHLDKLFPGMEIVDHDVFRVTRDADFTVSDEADDLLRAVEDELRRRRFGEVVRVEVGAGMAPELREPLTRALGVDEADVFPVVRPARPRGPVADRQGAGLRATCATSRGRRSPSRACCRRTTSRPTSWRPCAAATSSSTTRTTPSRRSVERLVEQAVADPDVLAIKQTVYRTSDDSPLVPALIRAAERGKQAVCLVELKARFDERANIQWARALEEAGVHVVYGLPALKTHAKCILIVRREGDGVRHYVHVGTGNYNPKTARLYTDFGLLTCDDRIGADVADMFNQLTGFARPQRFRRVLVAPGAHARRHHRRDRAHDRRRPARAGRRASR